MRPRFGDVLRWFRRDPLGFGIPGFTDVEEIAGGGFATVYRACQPQFSRTVVVKVLHVHGLTSSFERECRALGMLGGHPNVVGVFDAALDKSGRPYIVMEYLPAGSLADRLEADGQLSWEEVVAIGVKLAGALESAHQADVVHLDVKPANVLVGPDGEPKLADFGIARMRAALGAKRATQTLALTPGYAAPERFKEDEPTVAADVYGLGATLFTLLVGHSPFLRSRDEQPWPEVVIGRVLYEPVPELDLEFLQGLRAVVRRAMAKKAVDRYESAAQLGEALQAVQRQNRLAVTPLLVIPVADIPAPPPPPVRHRRLAVVSILAVVTLVAGAVIAFVRPPPCARPQADGALSFGTLLPKTGQFLYSGPAMEAGVQLAMKDVNAAGAIPGIVVKLDEANQHDEGDPFSGETASKATDPLLSGRVDVILGPATSAVAGKVIDKVVCAGVVVFSPSNSASVFTTYDDRGLYFRTGPSNVLRGPLLGELVVADGNSTAVVIARDDLSGNDFRRLVEQGIKASGGSVLDSFSYDPTAPNHDRDVQRIKGKDPDAIVLSGFSESASILREMIEQGLGPQRRRVYAGTTMSNTLARLVNPQDPGVLAGMRGMFVDDGGEAFVARLREVDPGLQEFTFGAETYDAVVVTALAAAVAGTDAPAAIAEQVNGVTKGGVKCTSYADCIRLVQEHKDIDYDGASGPLEFTDPGEPSSATYVISEFQADGSLKHLQTVEVHL